MFSVRDILASKDFDNEDTQGINFTVKRVLGSLAQESDRTIIGDVRSIIRAEKTNAEEIRFPNITEVKNARVHPFKISGRR